jgi:hypothetical protein
VTYDGAVGHLVNGSLKMDVTASSAAAGATVQWASPTAPPYIPVVAGQPLTVTAWGRRSSANWRPKLGIAWYDASNVLISTSTAGPGAVDYVHTNTTFLLIGHVAIAPANALSARIVLVGYENTSSTTGQVWFDEIRWRTTALFMATQATGVTADVSGQLTEGYYG